MEKLKTLVDYIIDDVNQDSSKTIMLYSKLLQNLFIMILLTGVPYLMYVIFSLERIP